MLIYLRNVSFTITRVKYGLQLILYFIQNLIISSTPSILRINDIVVNNPVELADCFNHHFSEVAIKLANNLPPSSVFAVNGYLTKRVFPTIFLKPVASDEITNIINDLKTNKAGSYDMISCYFIKLSSSILIPILVLLINAYFSLGVFPDDLKVAKVIPLFKKGDTLDINNYRLIFLLTCFQKFLKKQFLLAFLIS